MQARHRLMTSGTPSDFETRHQTTPRASWEKEEASWEEAVAGEKVDLAGEAVAASGGDALRKVHGDALRKVHDLLAAGEPDSAKAGVCPDRDDVSAWADIQR